MKKVITYHNFILLILLIWVQNLKSCPSISLSVSNNVSCFGGFNGSVDISVSGPNGPFNITWDLGASSGSLPPLSSGLQTSLSGLQSGVLSVYVTDQIGCTSLKVITVNQPDPIIASTIVTDVDCYGVATGRVDLIPDGGTPPYSYNWSNGSSSQDLTGAFAGNYSVVISDQNSCSSSSIPSTINEPAEPLQTSSVSSNVLCKFGSSGLIDLSTWGGTAPYTFSWNSGSYLSEDISNLPANTYTVLVTDKNGCQESNSILITEPTQLTSSISASDVLCNSTSTGSINLTPLGGTLPYSYTWANSSLTLGNSEDLANIPAEDYLVTITDGNDCKATNTIIVNEPPLLTSSIISKNVSCFGGSDGNIDLIVSGGTPPFTFSWNNSSSNIGSSEDLSDIPAETYSVEITDFNGCKAFNNVVITQPLSPLTLSYSKIDVLCHGNNTGSIDISVNGGTPGYVYSWSNSATSEDVINLLAGSYSITVKDINDCIESEIIEIIQPIEPITNSSIISDVKCFADSSGAINISTFGGTSPYRYNWISSQFTLSTSSEDLNDFPAEEYILTITDNHDCILNDTLTINQPPKLEGILYPTDVLCHGDLTGAINLVVSGGVNPYNFSWSNSSITEDLVNISNGEYFVTITDNNNCIYNDSTTVNQPLEPLTSNYNTTEPLCPGGFDGTIYYEVDGGTMPYSYLWTNGDTTPTIFNLNSGIYQVTTTDFNGCVISEGAILEEPDEISTNEIITNLSCFESGDGVIDLSVTGGTAPYTFYWVNSEYELSVTSEDLTGYSADNYTVTITDENNCEHNESFIINQPRPLQANELVKNITCYGDRDGGITINPTGGTPEYSILWDSGYTDFDIQNLGPGNYTYTLSDYNNCTVSDSILLENPEFILFNEVITWVSCRDQQDGIIEVYPTGGYGEYQYVWSTGGTEDSITKLFGGLYDLTLTDLVGCIRDTTFIMPVTDIDCLEVPNAFTPNGDGINDDWQMKNMYLYPNASVEVFNKWGKSVFIVENGYNNFWDGTKGGRQLPADTYYYIIIVREDINPFTGPITIVR